MSDRMYQVESPLCRNGVDYAIGAQVELSEGEAVVLMGMGVVSLAGVKGNAASAEEQLTAANKTISVLNEELEKLRTVNTELETPFTNAKTEIMRLEDANKAASEELAKPVTAEPVAQAATATKATKSKK